MRKPARKMTLPALDEISKQGSQAEPERAPNSVEFLQKLADLALRAASPNPANSLGEQIAEQRELYEHLAKSDEPAIRRKLALSVHYDKILEGFARDLDPIVRANVARNPNATTELLHELASDADNRVLLAVKTNPLAPPDILINVDENIRRSSSDQVSIAPVERGMENNIEVDLDRVLLTHGVSSAEARVRLVAEMRLLVEKTKRGQISFEKPPALQTRPQAKSTNLDAEIADIERVRAARRLVVTYQRRKRAGLIGELAETDLEQLRAAQRLVSAYNRRQKSSTPAQG